MTKINWISSTESDPWRTRAPLAAKGNRLYVGGGSTEHQSWRGFGGCFNEHGYHAMLGLSDPDRRAIVDALFDDSGCRFNIGRLPIGASDYGLEWYSHNEYPGDFAMEKFSIERDHEYLLPYIKLALGRRPDLTLFASPWSPPTWLKHPRAYNFGTLIEKPEYLQAYALYFVKFVRAYAAAGVKVAQIHLQNEPDADQKFPSCLWTGARMRDFIRDYLGPTFRREGIDSEIWLGTLNTDDYDGFTLAALSDPVAYEFIAGVGYQWAGKAAVQRTSQSWPEKGLMQTENECGDGRNDWDYATYVFELVRHYIENGCDSYVYWNMILPPGGVSTWGWKQNSMITVDPDSATFHYNPEYYVMRHYAGFIDPGATRLSVNGPWAGNTLCFRNPRGQIVTVLNNPLPDAIELTLDFGDAATVELPPRSFNTVVFDGR